MITVTIIGAGNVAFHLCKAIYSCNELQLQQIYNRSEFTAEFDVFESHKTHNIKDLMEAAIYIISVSDNSVATVANSLPFENKLVVHTTGSVGMTDLPSKNRRGVFYPLQTFSKSKNVDFSKIPLCLEAENEADLEFLKEIASKLSESMYEIDSDQRKAIHLAAVYVNNFTNHLFYVADTLCKDKKIPFEILKPLVEETVDKIKHLNPLSSQTGPAKRKDSKTIETHLAQLTDYPEYKDIYKVLTNSILKTYE
ncbi:hypothetical protein NBRC110019_04240 [Neptunitalea chrysea]|uniref:DUF2520 domain-containing protein n=1 Tax=Neptunitalea chrysea TaxID=1647581 RepID=A0A9W6B353_9FLAO|nr:DUF2520 domain-containing protein [Neptunitalea chrysea]GLB51385.1 hypothetical protein NBRC110019_04240 [Neptunitalea chrysea]